MLLIRRRAYARAGLVGNPSDGYFGKTLSLIVRNFWAEATLYEWDQLELMPSQEDHSRFESLAELVRDVRLHGYYGGIRLVKATVKKFAEYCLRRDSRCTTAISPSATRATCRGKWGWPAPVRSSWRRCDA